MRTGVSGSVPPPDAPGAGDGAPAGKASWRRPRPFSRRQWYPIVGVTAVAALLAGVAMALLTLSRGPQARPLAHSCGLVTCAASLPPAVLGTAVPSTAVHSTAPVQRHPRPPALAPAVHRRVRPAAPLAAPSAAPRPTPSPAPRPTPSPAPRPGSWARHHHRHHHHWQDDGD
jgi:hypothetical protein